MTAATPPLDLKDNLRDIQDNVVAPILMRYRRHIFLKFNDGAKARARLGNMFKRVNARPEEHGTRFSVNVGFTYEGLKTLGALSTIARQLSRSVPRWSAGPCTAVGDTSDPFAGTLGGWWRFDCTPWPGFAPIPMKDARKRLRIVRAEMEAVGDIEIRFVQDTKALAHENGIGSEGQHLGFVDPISQPPIEGVDTPSHPGDGELAPEGRGVR